MEGSTVVRSPRDRTRSSWYAMWYRCKNAATKDWPRYGGRGITVCERWKSFDAFLEDMGCRPDGLVLDRTNNDGNYEPGNCRWVTVSESLDNRRYKKQSKQARGNLCASTYHSRKSRGWPERLLTRPAGRAGRAKRTSVFRGVKKTLRSPGRWLAYMKVDGRYRYIKTCRTELQAALAYDQLAREIRGDRALLNFPERYR